MSVRHLERIRAAVADAGADALWIHPAVDFRYLTGLAPIAVERPTALVILAAGGLRVLAPQMLAPELEIEGAEVTAWSDGEGPDAAIARVLDGVGRCLIEPDLPSGVAFALPAGRPGLELVLDPGILAGLRECKAPDELEHLRAAGREADAAMEWIAGADLDGRSERWLALELQARFLRRGVEPYASYIVASGANGALPHHETGETAIAAGAPLLTDFGCVVGGYLSDTTRVHLPADGGEAAEAYAIVRAAHDAVIAGLEPGLTCEAADRLARDVIEAAGHGERFIHRTGHGVGLEIHEEPYLRPGNPAPLQVGHVFSVEPGIYVPGRFGVRYENLVHLGADGPELLNRSP
ncbi:MAG: Xaa-Pro dipeptidase [Solirubrobacteraceae bacterium]|nr:Xaa-Pro dipeptidase [Solirubrobacteraceae bacterium]